MKKTALFNGDRILLVDDDDDFRDLLSEKLELLGNFEVETAASATEALMLANSKSFKIIVLDVGLPDMDGRDTCQVMRRNGIVCPIVMLSGLEADSDAILGLDRGANDYVTKPVSFNVFLARIRAHMRQHERCDDAELTIGRFIFKPSTKKLIDEGNNLKINLSEKETSVLKRLYQSGNNGISKGKLLSEIWGYNPTAETHTVETHIYRLRQKIEDDPSDPKILVLGKNGYRLKT
ncbi:MAG: response regulator transcription factor [Rhodospirillales bacterium]